MKPNKEKILAKTHYGLNIYAHILKHFYPVDAVLSLSGRECLLAKNPFNDNRQTLKISIKNKLATHIDVQSAEEGDAFSFAAMHYKLEGDPLFTKLNEEMHLKLGESTGFYNRPPDLERPPSPVIENSQIPSFSFFKSPVTNTVPQGKLSLTEVYQLIKGDSYQPLTAFLRKLEGKEASKYKAGHFDYVTFSGLFSRRNERDLIQHSGLLAIDFDGVASPGALREQLLIDEYFETELLFLSPSGNGLKWIIPIDLAKATHLDYFKSISNYISTKYRLKIDPSGKDISRACFLPYDPNIYINPKHIL